MDSLVFSVSSVPSFFLFCQLADATRPGFLFRDHGLRLIPCLGTEQTTQGKGAG